MGNRRRRVRLRLDGRHEGEGGDRCPRHNDPLAQGTCAGIWRGCAPWLDEVVGLLLTHRWVSE